MDEKPGDLEQPWAGLQKRVGQLPRQAQHDERGGDVDEQHVLHHVRGEEKGFADLVEGRTDGEIRHRHAEMEADTMTTRIAQQAGGAARPQGPDG